MMSTPTEEIADASEIGGAICATESRARWLASVCRGRGPIVLALVITGLFLAAIGAKHVTMLHYVGRHTPSDTRNHLYLMDTDAHQWVLDAQQAVATKQFRLRWIESDNAPFGRELHWSSGYLWWLIFLGETHSLITKTPLANSIEYTALFANPLLLFGALCFAAWFFPRLIGVRSTVFFLLASISTPWIYHRALMPGVPDHHGIILACLVALTAALYSVSVSGRPSRSMLWAGVFAGTGMWISALTFFPAIAIILAGWAGAEIYRRHEGLKSPFSPELWRRFGAAAAATSIFFYILEYFPHHMGLRMEVNHPLYAIALWGEAELLVFIVRWIRGTPVVRCPGDKMRRLAAAITLFPAPLVIAVGGSAFFIPADPVISQFLGTIGEMSGTYSASFLGVGLFAVTAIGTLAMFIDPRFDPRNRAALLPMIICAAGVGFFTLLHIRWMDPFQGIVLFACCLALFLESRDPARHCVTFASVIVVTLSLHIGLGGWKEWREIDLAQHGDLGGYYAPIKRNRDAQQVASAIQRDARARGIEAPLVAAMPDNATFIAYYLPNARTVGRIYWESAEGIRSVAEMFATVGFDGMVSVLRSRHVDYIVLPAHERPHVALSKALYGDIGMNKADFASDNLQDTAKTPPWLALVEIPKDAALSTPFLIYRVIADKLPAESAPATTGYPEATAQK